MTVDTLFWLLGGMRVRLVIGAGFTVRVEVPRSFTGVARALLESNRPVAVVFSYAPLAWWRCWFVRHQSVEVKR
jgi:hypothetical protein